MEPITATLASGLAAYQLAKMVAKEIATDAPKIADKAKNFFSGSRKEAASAKSPGTGPDNAKDSDFNAVTSIESRVLAVESSIHDLQSEMLASTDLIKALADQNAQFAKYIEASRLQFEVIENQNGILVKKVKANSELLISLEAKNSQLAKDVEVERLRVSRLTGLCIAVGVVAVIGLAMVVRLSFQ
jgi:chromosome segregation ATPase